MLSRSVSASCFLAGTLVISVKLSSPVLFIAIVDQKLLKLIGPVVLSIVFQLRPAPKYPRRSFHSNTKVEIWQNCTSMIEICDFSHRCIGYDQCISLVAILLHLNNCMVSSTLYSNCFSFLSSLFLCLLMQLCV